MRFNKHLFIGVTLGICISIGMPLIAKTTQYILNQVDYKLVVFGKEFKPQNDVLSYNGITYLPLRDVGDALGIKVAFNDGTIYLGNNDTSATTSTTPDTDDRNSHTSSSVDLSEATLITGNYDKYNVTDNHIDIEIANGVGKFLRLSKDKIPVGKIGKVFADSIYESSGKVSKYTFYCGYINGDLYFETTFADSLLKY